MPKLTEDQLLRLRPHVAQYSFDRLKVLLRTVTNDDRIDALGTPLTPLAELAGKILDDANDSGYLDVLLRAMLKQADYRPQLRDAALAMFPNLAITESRFPALVADAVRSIETHRDRFTSPDAKRAAVTFASALSQLARYKGLHAAIMSVSNASVPQLTGVDGDERDLFLQDVDQSLSQIERALVEVRDAFAASDIAMVPQRAWIDGFDRSLVALRIAREGQDVGAAIDIIDDVAGQATFVLGYSNGVMAATYGLLPFDPLGAALTAAAPHNADPMSVLREALQEVIQEHDAWQQAYRGLARLDRCLKAPPRNAFVSFEGAWRQTRGPLEKLINDPRGLPWARQARAAVQNLQVILTEVANEGANDDELSSLTRAKLRGPLDDLREICRRRFLTVATGLKGRLAEMADLQTSLSSIGGEP